LAEKLSILVGELNEFRVFDYTTDFDKIKYNLKLMEGNFNQNLDIGLNFSEMGIAEVIDLGKYIAIVEINKDKKLAVMWFFDVLFNFKRDVYSKRIKSQFNKIITEKFIDYYNLIQLGLSPFKKSVELSVPMES
tara:strand:+ start:83 stop:484 length:402 start_codon:yes stop_codon:yes gene_type:complete